MPIPARKRRSVAGNSARRQIHPGTPGQYWAIVAVPWACSRKSIGNSPGRNTANRTLTLQMIDSDAGRSKSWPTGLAGKSWVNCRRVSRDGDLNAKPLLTG